MPNAIVTQCSITYTNPFRPCSNDQSMYLFISQITRLPLSRDPAVEEIQGSLWLIHRYHMTSLVNPGKGQVTRALTLSILSSVGKLEGLGLSLVEGFLSRPLKSIRPGLVSEPVADEISVSSVDQDWDLLEDGRDETVVWLHPITLEEEVAVDVEVAGIVSANLGSESLDDVLLVQVIADVSEGGVAEVAIILTLTSDVIDVLAGSLVWANEVVIAVD